jgi:hypothetical protein
MFTRPCGAVLEELLRQEVSAGVTGLALRRHPIFTVKFFGRCVQCRGCSELIAFRAENVGNTTG